MQLQSIEIIKSGQGNKGPWNLVKATFGGKTYSGFVYDKIPAVGEDLEVEFFQEEYNGKMQDKFKILSKKASQEKIAEMAIKTHIDRHFQALRADLKVIADHLGVAAPKPMVGNTGIEYPEGPVDVFTQAENNPENDEINPEDIPF